MSTTRRAFLGGAATATALALAGCGDDGDTASTPTPTPARTPTETVTVRMFDSSFTSETLSIEPWTQVVWENRDNYAHTVTSASDNWSFDEEVAADERATHLFDSDGVYDVYCRFHGSDDLTGMSMRIAVGDATIPDS